MENSTQEALRGYFAEVQLDFRAPSLAFGVAINGEVVARSEAERPFRIASMTKSFTAAAALLLRDRGLLQLDRPIVDYVPELRLQAPTSDSPAITLRHLLTMSSGLANDDPWGDRHLDADKAFMQQLFESGGFFAVAPGTEYVYSNYGYAMVGQAISNVTGTSYQRFITTELLEPLAMRHTTWGVPVDGALPFRILENDVVEELPPLPDGGFGAMGGLWSTVNDLLKWVHFLMNAFPARNDDDSGPLRRASLREMQTVHTHRPPVEVARPGVERTLRSGYGMGLIVYPDDRMGNLVGHSGGLPGYGSNMTWCPDRKVALVSLANITYAPMYLANDGAAEILLERGEVPDIDRKVPSCVREQANALIGLLNNFEDHRADEVFADNVKWDLSYQRRREQLRSLTSGSPLRIEKIYALNDAVAQVFVKAGDASWRVSMSISSQLPPRIQFYEIAPVDTGAGKD